MWGDECAVCVCKCMCAHMCLCAHVCMYMNTCICAHVCVCLSGRYLEGRSPMLTHPWEDQSKQAGYHPSLLGRVPGPDLILALEGGPCCTGVQGG